MLEHERYGKHSLADDGNAAVFTSTRDMSPANWIPLNPSPGTADRQVVAKAPAKIIDAPSSRADPDRQSSSTIVLELSGGGLTLTLRWPVQEHKALADWTRTLLT